MPLLFGNYKVAMPRAINLICVVVSCVFYMLPTCSALTKEMLDWQLFDQKSLQDWHQTPVVSHTFSGTGEMRINPERGFRHEIHGACTGDGRNGISDTDIKQLAQFNMTVAQVYCYLPTTATLDSQDLNAISAALVRQIYLVHFYHVADNMSVGNCAERNMRTRFCRLNFVKLVLKRFGVLHMIILVPASRITPQISSCLTLPRCTAKRKNISHHTP